MSYTELLMPGAYYHIYNHVNDPENCFRERRNYPCFMRLYARYAAPVARVSAFCLMPNHFHFLLRIRELDELAGDVEADLDATQYFVSLQFANWFSTYTKAFNHTYSRRGSLFMRPFRRKRVSNDKYFQRIARSREAARRRSNARR